MENTQSLSDFSSQGWQDNGLPQRESEVRVESKKTFGEFIQQKRKEVGLTQRGLADKLYITESAVSKWERGLSYPDITLIKDLCEVLGVTDHELLTASEDVEARTNEKLAAKYLSLIKRFKWTQILIYGAALLVCLICNIAIQHTVSWFFIVLTSVMIAASLTLVPVLVNRRKALVALGCFTASLLLLFLVCNLYTNGDWFIITAVSVLLGLAIVFLPLVLRGIALLEKLYKHKTLISFIVDTILLLALLIIVNRHVGGDWLVSVALPVTAFWLLLPWGMLIIIRYVRINGFFKTAACLGLFSAMYCFGVGITDFIVTGTPPGFGYAFDFLNWSRPMVEGNVNMLIFFVFLLLTVIFVTAGIVVSLRRYRYETG